MPDPNGKPDDADPEREARGCPPRNGRPKHADPEWETRGSRPRNGRPEDPDPGTGGPRMPTPEREARSMPPATAGEAGPSGRQGGPGGEAPRSGGPGVTPRVSTVPREVRVLPRLAVGLVLTAVRAVLAEVKPVRVVTPVLPRDVVAVLALLAGQRDLGPDVCRSQGGVPLFRRTFWSCDSG
jgi:hypothetical protein